MAKTYGQFCGLARALDRVGDRWTLLIVRELLLHDAGYGELHTALEGIPTNLLADRLRDLEADGVVERATSQEDRRRVTYRLTSLGRGLEPALRSLIVWGAHWMAEGPGDDRFDPRWANLALRALLDQRMAAVSGVVELRFDGRAVRVGSGADPAEPDATVEGDATVLLGLASGQLTLGEARRRGLRVRGDRALLRRLLDS